MVPSHWDRENRPSGYHIGIERPKSERSMRLLPGFLSPRPTTRTSWPSCAHVLGRAPLYSPAMPRSGSPYSVRMSNCGSHGWLSDRSGYRYSATHPVTGAPWPDIPRPVLELWHDDDGRRLRARGLPDQLLRADGQARVASRPGRGRQGGADPVDLAGRHGAVPAGRARAQEPDPIVPAGQRRSDGPRRPVAPLVPWRRPHPARAPASSCRKAAGSTSPCGG